jgi:sarcosine/dimethylglycine N-methyltransferase
MHLEDVSRYYDDHPISEPEILADLRRRGKDLDHLTPDDLYPLDQDHYGGLEAVETLARRAGIGPGSRVLDVCAGLAGPARFLAERFGARVTALDLNHERCAGGLRLTRLVRLASRVVPVQADATTLPFRAEAFTAVVSQEGLLHVADKAAALAGCARVLIPGGRIALTDWTATSRLGDGERQRLQTWMAATDIQTRDGYRTLLARAGFHGIETEDISGEWLAVLRQRRRLHVTRRAERAARFGQARHDGYEQLQVFFLGLVESRKIGGARFSASVGR